MSEPIYSIRMRASRCGEHISGAEDLAPQPALEGLAAELVRRALTHSRGSAEQVRLAIDLVDSTILRRASLPSLKTLVLSGSQAARRAAVRLLGQAGVQPAAAMAALAQIAAGAAGDGQVMRGAMLVDGCSGERLEGDRRRGVRVSRFGLDAALVPRLETRLAALGLARRQVKEALQLAGKVVLHPDVLAELCWSDDPDYTTGYVCSHRTGYVRIPDMKPAGDRRGGRALFLRSGSSLAELGGWLETVPVLFDDLGEFHLPSRWEDDARELDPTTR